MANIQNTLPSSTMMPRLFDFFPCQGRDLAREFSSAARNERTINLARLRRGVADNFLTLSTQDLWDIKKTLTRSDIENHQTRLMIPKEPVNKHILKYFTKDVRRRIKGKNRDERLSIIINVYDGDTKSIHQLCFKRWNSSKSYVLNKNWNTDFVERRNLQEGDEIGLFWNPYESRLHFSVLRRAN